MQVEMTKRRNFSLYETETLLTCVEQHKEVIENKSTNAATNKEKANAWFQLMTKFNSVPGVEKCSVLQLQNLYKNIKRRTIKRIADNKIDILKTCSDPIVQVKEEIDEDASNTGFVHEPLPCAYDSDQALETTNCESPSLPDNTTCTTDSVSEPETLRMPNYSVPPKVLTENRRNEPSSASVKAAEALEEQSKARKAAIEAESMLVQQKLQKEIKQSKELHEMKLKVLQAKLLYYEKLIKQADSE